MATTMETLDIFPVDWAGVETETAYEIRCFGKLQDGRSACVRIPFVPYFYVACPPTWTRSRASAFVAECVMGSMGALAPYSMPITRKTIWGFTNSESRLFAQLAFPTVHAAKRARRIVLDKLKMQTYEASVDHLMRLFHVRNLAPARWVHVAQLTPVLDTERETKVPIEVTAPFASLSPSPLDDIPAIVFASWDIECYSASGAFPIADKPGDVICCICTSFQRYGADAPFQQHAVTLGTCAPVPGVMVVACDTEENLINAWIEALRTYDADVLCGWNTMGFDYKYLYGRSLIAVNDATGESLVDLRQLGKAVDGGGIPVQKQLSSAAYGDNNYWYLSAPGILHLDLMQLIKKEHKLDSYRLDVVAEKFLGDRKIDLKPAELFAKFLGSDDDRAVIVEYCAKDTMLPLQLMTKLNIYQNMLEMANAVSVPVDYLITRGQQIKVYSLILKKARQLGFVCPDLPRTEDGTDQQQEKYKGATVLDAHTGAYLDDVVSALDFASLYPSIIRSMNACPSTLVMHPKYANIPGIDYHTVSTPQGDYTFAQAVESVLPSLLEDLAKFRKDAKRKMAAAKAAGDAFQAAIWNGAQLAYKVSMNSAYGFFGAQKGFLPCIPIAASVTATGRLMIQQTKALVEQLVPGSRVVYGDSVAGYTPILLRHPTGATDLTTFAQLGGLFRSGWITSPCGKEYLPIPPGVDIWSDLGWTPFIRAIRHTTPSSLLRVITRTGLVDVTPDHSMLLRDGTPIRPGQLMSNDLLLHADLPTIKHQLGGAMDTQPHLHAAARFLQMTTPILQLDPVRPGDPHGWSVVEAPFAASADVNDGLIAIFALPVTTDYVYDATTANHHFAAGIGRLVVHNTDSVMVIFNTGEGKRTDMKTHFHVAQDVADRITKTFKKPNELEFEKCYYPYVLFSKKRYCGMLYSRPEAPDYMDVKGLQLVRRDNCPLVKTVSTDILHAIMHDRSRDLAVDAARRHILALLRNEHPLTFYVVSKALRSDYKAPDSQPHLQVAKKIHGRRGYPVPSGERVPYVFIENPDNPDGLQASRAEDPVYVAEHGLIIDRLHYLQSQLAGPIETLLDVLRPGTYEAMMQAQDIKPLVDELRAKKAGEIKVAKRVRTNTTNKQKEITSFFAFR